jgi:hypothetical protein
MKIQLLSPRFELPFNLRLLEECKKINLECEHLTKGQLFVTSRPHEDALIVNRLPLFDPWGIEGSFLSQVNSVNSYIDRLKYGTKMQQQRWLCVHDLPSLPSLQWKKDCNAQLLRDWLQSECSSGWVLKMNRGLKGIGVHFGRNMDELLSWAQTFQYINEDEFLVQPWLEGAQEWRAMVLNSQLWSVLQRSSVDQGPANFAQGGHAEEKIPVSGLKKIVHDWCDLNPSVQYAALDILEKNGKFYLIDINLCPGIEQLENVTKRNFVEAFLKVVLKAKG